MSVLEARFRYEEGGWRLKLVDEHRVQISDKPWAAPSTNASKEALFESLFDDRDRHLVSTARQLRLRPEKLVPPGPMPSAPWSTLFHPIHRCHVLEAGWTMMEVVRESSETRLSGQICVDGAAEWRDELRRRLGPRVRPLGQAWEPGDLVVVRGAPSAPEVEELQRQAETAMVGLICFTHCRAARRGIPQVHATGSNPLSIAWVANFFKRLLRGATPEEAFRATGIGEERERHADRWLLGHAGVWTAPQAVSQVPTDWFARLDRAHQDHRLQGNIDGLIAPGSLRRVHVLVTSGPIEAGLDLFQERTVLHASVKPVSVIDADLAWTEDPAQQEHAIWRFVGARNRRELVGRLVSRNPEQGRVVLFSLRHELCALGGPPVIRRVPVAALHTYLNALRAISVALAPTSVRLMVHLGVVGDVIGELEQLKRACPTDASFELVVLSPLGAVPKAEIEGWLEDHGFPFDDDFVEYLATLTYDDLVEALATRYPDRL